MTLDRRSSVGLLDRRFLIPETEAEGRSFITIDGRRSKAAARLFGWPRAEFPHRRAWACEVGAGRGRAHCGRFPVRPGFRPGACRERFLIA